MNYYEFCLRVLNKLHICKNKWPLHILKYANMQTYKERVGYEFDLDNPVTFPEKIQWYKFNYYHPDMHNIVDKYRFKNYITEHLGEGHTIPLIKVWYDVDSIVKDWDSLPNVFCLKCNVQSDGNFIKFIKNKNEININVLKQELLEWLNPYNTLINSYCRAYYKCTPCIIAEVYMENVSNQLFDYKFYCFNGEPYCICTSKEHFQEEYYPISYFDTEWNLLDVQSGKHKVEFMPKPTHFTEMLEYAKKLSKDFPMVRVDFFDTEEKLYVAELTFYPGGGFFSYNPPSFNNVMGDLFVLPSIK